MPKSMRQVINEYLNSDQTASLSRNSRRRARYVTDNLLRVVEPGSPVTRLEPAHIDRTLSIWRGRIGEGTINTYRGNLRIFGKYLFDHGYTKTNVAGHLRNQRTKPDMRKRKHITADQARHMVKVAGERHPRDAMTVMIAIYTGLRESEICGLQWSGVDLDGNTLTVYRPKVRDWHSVPLAPTLRAELVQWRTWVTERHGTPDGDHFVVPALAYRDGPGNARMHPEWPLAMDRPQTQLGPRIKGWLREVGETDLNGRASHVLRRFAAEHILTTTGNVRDAQTLLGHRSPAETERYLDRDAARDRLREKIQGWEI